MTMTMNDGWIASLSNGETVFETPPVPGELSAWQKLLHRLRSEKVTRLYPDAEGPVQTSLKITGLRLQRWGVNIQAMPHKMCDGYLACYEVRESLFRGDTETLQGIGSVLGDQVFITWISLTNSQGITHVSHEVRDLSSCRIHTTLS